MKILIHSIVILVGVAVVSPVFADEVYTFVVKKQEEKAKNRWSIDEWLKTRDKMRLMDLWLALHSPSPYEFYLGGDYQMMKNPSGDSGMNFQLAGYASIFGLGLQKTWAPGDQRALATFFLRIFGYYAQGMNITLQGGVRQSEITGASFRNGFAGIGSTIYLTKFFGLEGLYRHNFASATSDNGATYSGPRYEGGAFIDFKFFRIYGTYFSEDETQDLGGALSTQSRTGTALGFKLFF